MGISLLSIPPVVIPLVLFHTEIEQTSYPEEPAPVMISEPVVQELPPDWIGHLDGRVSLVGGEITSSQMQYDWATEQGLRFVRTSAMYNEAVQTGYFVRLSHPRLRVLARRPHVLTSTARFVYTTADAYHAAGCGRLTVTGAGRLTSERPRNGSVHSVHPAGMAVDLRVNGIGERCEAWLTTYLTEKEAAGEIDATREYKPPHFHVVVPEVEYSDRVYLTASYKQEQPEP